MHTVKLFRVSQDDYATLGVLVDDVAFAVTLEDPWRDNQPNISCIPPGFYWCERVQSPKFGDTFTVLDVPGRTLIRFHWGSKPDDTEGCILVAEEFAMFDNKPGIARSRYFGFKEFMMRLQGRERFPLYIIDVSKVI